MDVAELPTPKGALPLVGHALRLDIPTMHRTLEGWASEQGGAYRIRLGRKTALVISDPSSVASVLADRPAGFRRMSAMARVVEEVGVRGVFTAEGEAWKEQRRLAMRALGRRRIRAAFPLLQRITSDLRLCWQAERERDLRMDFAAFTVDVTTELAFSERAGSLTGERSELVRLMAPVFPEIARRLFALVPTWRIVDRTGLPEIVEEMRAYAGHCIEQARRHPERDDLIAGMLAETDDEDLLFGNAITMLFAGEDTTANTLAWSVHLLLEHPDALERVRAEAHARFDGASIAPSFDHLRLPFLDGVIHEAMRLKPVAPIVFLEALRPTRVGEVEVDAGTPVLVLLRAPSLDPTRFEAPERFDPERWAEPDRVMKLQREGAFVPFGSGPRMCPGRDLALLELRMVLSMLALGFDIERIGAADEVREVNGFTMHPSQLGVRFTERVQ